MPTSSAPSLLLICALLGGCTTLPQPPTSRPNVVILYTDDQGYGDCSALNPRCGFTTQHMDRLAREGLVFTDGHSAGSVCTPSRYALLTGRYPWRTPQRNAVLGADADCMIENGRTTIASLLREQDYATGMFGKWHLGMQIPGTIGQRNWSVRVTDGPLQKGFDHFFGLPASMNFGVLTWFEGDRATAPATMWTRKKFPEAEITTPPLDYRMAPPYDAERQTERDIEVAADFADENALRIITEHAINFIREQADRPFFALVAFTSPHLPHCTAPEFRGTSGMGNYGDFLVETDHRVGQILKVLDQCGVARDTLLILTSDNGPENNYQDWQRIYGHESSGGFRGGKRDVYEGGHRVPFLVRWPAVIKAGRCSDLPVGQVDLLATIADILGTGLENAHGEDSFSLLPVLHGSGASQRLREPLIHFGRGHFALRIDRWKLVFDRHPSQKGGLGPPAELYDLKADPAEETNVLQDHPQLAERLCLQAKALIDGNDY